MNRELHIWLTVLLLMSCGVMHAQSTDRDFIRLGNRYYRSGQYQKAEVYYRKALEKKTSLEAYYNLGNALVMQGQDSTADVAYRNALGETSGNSYKKSHIYHNVGNLYYASGLREMKMGGQNAQKAFEAAVQNYKNALRLNPSDDQTRYNLVMAQHQLKKSQQNGGGGNNNQDKNQDKQQDKQQDKKQDQQQKQQEQQQQNQQQKQDKNQIDDKTAEQLLNSAQQDEKHVQQKMQKTPARRRNLDKDW